MIKIGIIGGAGYTAGELIRLLLNHPDAEITFVNSTSNAGNLITDVHSGLFGETEMRFTDELPLNSIDLLVLLHRPRRHEEVHGKPYCTREREDHRPQHGLPYRKRRA